MKFRGGFEARPPRMVTNVGIDMLAYPAAFPGTTEIRYVDIEGPDPAVNGRCEFIEFFCANLQCDCRRVMIQAWGRDGLLATIQYGWESPEFYIRWLHGDPLGAELAGVSLDPFQSPSPQAGYFRDLFEWVLEEDPAYEARLRRHYAEIKAASGGKKPRQAKKSGRKKRRGRG